ncbi:MAG TPA: hypothetical protein VGF46_04200 [Gaiellales bacterium]
MHVPTTTSSAIISTAFLDDPLDDSVPAAQLRRLAEEFAARGHGVEATPTDETDVCFASVPFGVPINWRQSLQLGVRRRFKLRHTPLTFAVMSVTPAQLQGMIEHFRHALAKSPIDPADFMVEGLEPTAVDTLVEQGRRGGAMLTVMRVLQTQAKNVRILLFVGEDENPSAVFHLDLVGGHPRTLALGDGSALWDDIVERVLATFSARDVTDHLVDPEIVTAAQWQAAPAREAMRTAGTALGTRRFFTQMIRVADLIAVPAVGDAIARQYSEGCFATWDTTLDGLVTTVTGSARPVDKSGLADDDLAVVVSVRPDGRGVVVRHVEGAENAPPSSEALELRDVDTDLPSIELGPEWGASAGATVPVIRSKLHGHRGVVAFDPSRVEFVSLPPSYYEHPVSCATAAQAAGIRSAFSNAECLLDPADPRTIAFTILPTHGLVTVERWVPGKEPFGELLEAMDAGQLEIEDRVPQGWHTYEPKGSERRHVLVDPTANLADDPLAGLGEAVPAASRGTARR